MKESAHDYYGLLRREYETEIRRLVPKYDDMVDEILQVLEHRKPATLLDVGCGVGNVTERVLRSLPEARLTAVDASAVMAQDATSRLASFGDRAQVIQTDVAELAPDGTFDAIYTNLVLHNIPHGDKPAALEAIHRWLAPGGHFVWSDLIRYDDVWLQDHFVRYRIEYALAAGCDRAFVHRSFDKEAQDDYPYALGDARAALEDAGFAHSECIWMHDTFAIIVATP